MSRFTLAKIAKVICAVVLITVGIGMYIHPVAADYFYPGGKYSGPHTGHFSAGDMKVFGIMIAIFGLGLVYSAFHGSGK
jgi:hypothetical protein